jgi:hypothetical protein
MGVGLEGRRVGLERVRGRHVPALYEIAQSPGWPLAGGGLDPGSFAEQLWSAAPLQFSVIKRETDEVIGFVRGVHWDQRSRTIEVVFGVAPAYWQLLWPFEGVVIFCDYLFQGLGMRKLYFELRPSTLAMLGSGIRRWCTREWVSSRQVRSPDGELEDVELWSLTNWEPAIVDRLLGRARTAAVQS